MDFIDELLKTQKAKREKEPTSVGWWRIICSSEKNNFTFVDFVNKFSDGESGLTYLSTITKISCLVYVKSINPLDFEKDGEHPTEDETILEWAGPIVLPDHCLKAINANRRI